MHYLDTDARIQNCKEFNWKIASPFFRHISLYEAYEHIKHWKKILMQIDL